NDPLSFSSNLSPKLRGRMEHVTGVSTRQVLETQRRKEGYEPNESSTTRVNETGYTRSSRSNDSRLEAGLYDDTAPTLPGTAITTDQGIDGRRDKHGMAVDQGIALANLDPRTRNSRPGAQDPRLGTSTNATTAKHRDSVPDDAIGVSRDWRLDSE
ncbi:MAG: hypothetical protein Q9169_007548, partial [Polycauliona sp. 2 TL-2023]